MTGPRDSRITWPDSHMLAAMLAAQRSPDPNTQVGAVIVNKKQRRVASGYNAFPNNIGSRMFSWEREADNILDTKYPYIVHAEKNAIFNAIGSVEGCTLYVTLYPCNTCMKDIIQAGIKRVIYLSNQYADTWQSQASIRMSEALDMPVEQHVWQDKQAVRTCLENLLELVT